MWRTNLSRSSNRTAPHRTCNNFEIIPEMIFVSIVRTVTDRNRYFKKSGETFQMSNSGSTGKSCSSSSSSAASSNIPSHPNSGVGTTIKTLSARIIPEQYVPLLRYVQRLAAERFFGDVVIQFTKGEITLIRVEQTLKPFDLAEASSPASVLGTTTAVEGGSDDLR